MKLKEKTFYVIKDFIGIGTDEYGEKTHGKKDIIFWNSNSCYEIRDDIIIEEATNEQKEYYLAFIDEGPTDEDYAAMSLDGFEEWKNNK